MRAHDASPKLPFGPVCEPAKPRKRKNGEAIAPDWQPSNGDREYGHTILNLTDRQIDDMAEDMRLWAGANANRPVARKSDWSLTFLGWMRREAKKGNSYRPNGNATNGNGQQRRSVQTAAADLVSRIRAFDEPAPSGIRGAASSDAARAIPKG